jgi:hypothetical protein
MFDSNRMRHNLKRIALLPAKVGRYISRAVLSIFSPNHDDYPKTGAQSFTGDLADKHF